VPWRLPDRELYALERSKGVPMTERIVMGQTRSMRKS